MALQETELKVDEALRDDFDTPTAMAALVELIKATNVYLETPDTIVYLVLQKCRHVRDSHAASLWTDSK